ncbi:MAG: hypothetical protein K0B02_03820 [DPANN group archaeon]|nr:hypothetical protein [DPANN group archaeon]
MTNLETQLKTLYDREIRTQLNESIAPIIEQTDVFDIDEFINQIRTLNSIVYQECFEDIKSDEKSRIGNYVARYLNESKDLTELIERSKNVEDLIETSLKIPFSVIEEFGFSIYDKSYNQVELTYSEENLPHIMIEQMFEREKHCFEWVHHNSGNMTRKSYDICDKYTTIKIETLTTTDNKNYAEKIKTDIKTGLELKKDIAILLSGVIKDIALKFKNELDDENLDTYQVANVCVSYLKRKNIPECYNDIIEKLQKTEIHTVFYDKIKSTLKLNPTAKEGTQDKIEMEQFLDYVGVLAYDTSL